MQVVHLRLADGTQAIVRLLTQHERNVELVALKLDRVLGFYRSPVVVQRRVQVTELLILAAQVCGWPCSPSTCTMRSRFSNHVRLCIRLFVCSFVCVELVSRASGFTSYCTADDLERR